MTSEKIKEFGLSIGYSNVGVTSVESLAGYIDEVLSRGDEYSFFHKMLTIPVQKKMPEAKSVIVLILDYFQHDFPEALQKMIGKIYLSRSYNPPLGKIEHSKLQLMKEYLSGNGLTVNSDVTIPARLAAAQAGVANFGRNNFAYADDIGSYIAIRYIVVDKVLEYGQPTMENKCPASCRVCINACPTKALYEPFKLNPNKCIAFNNWVTQDGRGTVSSFIPYELRESMGCKIHGCDVCQDVCPRNQKKLKQPKTVDRYLEKVEPELTLSAILNMSDEFFEQRIKPVLYNYISDKRYFMRNAALAMGNIKDESYVDDLETALSNPDAMIREYAVWALEKIGGGHAKNVIERSFAQESSEEVKQAMNLALAHISL
jgi:epoxyqueuosine reductase